MPGLIDRLTNRPFSVQPRITHVRPSRHTCRCAGQPGALHLCVRPPTTPVTSLLVCLGHVQANGAFAIPLPNLKKLQALPDQQTSASTNDMVSRPVLCS